MLNLVCSMLDGQCFMCALTGTTSSSNTMVPGNEGHHDSKIKDSNMEDRYKLKYSTIVFVLKYLKSYISH